MSTRSSGLPLHFLERDLAVVRNVIFKYFADISAENPFWPSIVAELGSGNVAFGRTVAMPSIGIRAAALISFGPRHHDLNAHLRKSMHNSVKIVHFKPQQDPVIVWLIFTIANRAMAVFNSEPVQLKNEFAIRGQLLILSSPMIAPTARQAMIPSAARFYIRHSDERLRTHTN